MERFLLVYRAAPEGAAGAQHDPQRWAAWFDALGAHLLERGSRGQGSVAIDTRLAGPKSSASALAGYSVLGASDFNEAVRLAQQCPIFDEHGSLEIAHLAP
ncbi:hypothetical protein [Pseudoduganella sp.]|uniref:hypothetical protein n=1 Tax=Pseudoduganella sp. TaxID=1880898 RepID=UPI0035B241A3